MHQRRVRAVLDGLCYDFQQFSFEHFLHYLEQQRGRPIIRVPYDFHAGLTGMWIPAETADYIIFARQTHPIHQFHIQLHEIAHILLKHQRLRVDTLKQMDTQRLLQKVERQSCGSVAFRQHWQEQEAERFVYLLQARIAAARRMDELTREPTSIAGLNHLTDALGWLE
jgi:hypothetical protein